MASKLITRSLRVNSARSNNFLAPVACKRYQSVSAFSASSNRNWKQAAWISLSVAGAAATTVALKKEVSADEKKTNWEDVRRDIAAILEDDKYDDGSYGPVLIRLAWHASGTYDKNKKAYGSNGATMRYAPEASHGANAGLAVPRTLLEKIKSKYPEISYADLWTLAGVVAVEEMGGPVIPWKPGRVDAVDEKACPPDGNLPDAAKKEDHIRDIFYRMGFSDQEIVALVGAHAVGRCHTDRSGFDGPWTKAPTMFSNEYFRELVENKWTKRNWNGPIQFEDESKELMMLPADIALIEDPKFKAWVEKYAKDEDLFFRDFAKAFGKLLALGVPSKAWYQFW